MLIFPVLSSIDIYSTISIDRYMYPLFHSDEYKKSFLKLDKAEQSSIIKIEKQLAINPLSSKPLSYTFLREKKVKDKRIIFFYDDKGVFLISIVNKKNQKEIINAIKKDIEKFKKLVKKL